MARYKTVGFTRCKNGHLNIFDIRLIADSAADAQQQTLLEAVLGKCKYCDTKAPLAVAQIEPSEKISLHLEYTIYGYTCQCGERVEVARVEKETTLIPPVSKTISCSKGHSRQILNQEFPFLEHWEEKTN